MELKPISQEPATTFLTAAEIPPNLPRVKIGEALRGAPEDWDCGGLANAKSVILIRDTRNFWRLSGDLERL